MTNITFGTAQIPVSQSIPENTITIKAAIDWAHDNSVDYLVTPEGSLSGYIPSFNEVVEEEEIVLAVHDVVDYAAKRNVGLALGTKYKENGLVYNQVRVYDTEGKFCGAHNKMYTIPEYDRSIMPSRIDPITIKHNGYEVKMLCLICNDFWGGYLQGAGALPKLAVEKETKADIILHSTNAMRGLGLKSEEVLYDLHNSILKFTSFELHMHVVTADNSIRMDGIYCDNRTSSRSGVVYNGEWLTEEKTSGTQYFKVNLDLDKLTSGGYQINPDEDIMRDNGIKTLEIVK